MLLCRLLFPRGSEGFLFSDSRKTASRQTHNTRSHPNMKKVTILISVLMLGAAFIRANADPAQITPVRWVIATQHNGDVDDKYVTLQGKVIKTGGFPIQRARSGWIPATTNCPSAPC
jgi:hypothetical protein